MTLRSVGWVAIAKDTREVTARLYLSRRKAIAAKEKVHGVPPMEILKLYDFKEVFIAN